jgi:hypothetical protein
VSDTSEERDRPSGSVPFSLRRRAGNLFEGRRRRILEEPVAALRSTGRPVQVSPRALHARVGFDDGTVVEVAFVSNRRLFGILIDTMWVGCRGRVGPGDPTITYSFKRSRFETKSDASRVRRAAERLSQDRQVANVIAHAELKTVTVREGEEGRQVEIVPQPGTITAVFLPPLPPFTVPFRAEESLLHLGLVRRILDT